MTTEQLTVLEQRVATLEKGMDAVLKVATQQTEMINELIAMLKRAGEMVIEYLRPAPRPEAPRKPS
jgi:O-acetylhomoserine/O-acetylserine sulfhydrylase-like pyridoxal-dependent enzyme